MQLAIKEAKKGVQKHDGGPFGAVIVRGEGNLKSSQYGHKD